MTTHISGTDGVDLIQDGTIQTPDFAAGVGPVLTKYYQSPEQTLGTTVAPFSLAHGLGAMPKLIRQTLICKVAQLGWSVGDEVDVSNAYQIVNATTRYVGTQVGANATTLTVRTGSDASGPWLMYDTAGIPQNLVLASWRLIVRAWA